MAKSSDCPYSRLVDLESSARPNPAFISGLRRTVTAAFIVATVAAIVAAGTIAFLAVLLYGSRHGELPVASDVVYQSSTVGPGAMGRTDSPASESPVDLEQLLNRITSLEKEVASLKAQCHTLLREEHTGKQMMEQEYMHSTAGTKMDAQKTSSDDKASKQPNSPTTGDLSLGNAKKQGSDHASSMTSHRDPSPPVTSSLWSRPSAAESDHRPSSSAGTHLNAHSREARSKDRTTKVRRRDRGETTAEDQAQMSPSTGSHGDRSERRRGGGDGGGGNRRGEDDTELAREEKKQRRAGKNSGRNQRTSDASPSPGRIDRETACIHCTDNDNIGGVDDDNFQVPVADGRAVHIQGNRDGNIRVSNDDGWIRGFQTWKLADWVDDAEPYFSLSPLGLVTVRESGIYYVYSQILFYDPNDTVGQSITINGAPRFTCTKSNISAEAKQSTCYVGGVVRLIAGDRVGIKLSIPSVTVALYADTSYFGLFRVA